MRHMKRFLILALFFEIVVGRQACLKNLQINEKHLSIVSPNVKILDKKTLEQIFLLVSVSIPSSQAISYQDTVFLLCAQEVMVMGVAYNAYSKEQNDIFLPCDVNSMSISSLSEAKDEEIVSVGSKKFFKKAGTIIDSILDLTLASENDRDLSNYYKFKNYCMFVKERKGVDEVIFQLNFDVHFSIEGNFAPIDSVVNTSNPPSKAIALFMNLVRESHALNTFGLECDCTKVGCLVDTAQEKVFPLRLQRFEHRTTTSSFLFELLLSGFKVSAEKKKSWAAIGNKYMAYKFEEAVSINEETPKVNFNVFATKEFAILVNSIEKVEEVWKEDAKEAKALLSLIFIQLSQAKDNASEVKAMEVLDKICSESGEGFETDLAAKVDVNLSDEPDVVKESNGDEGSVSIMKVVVIGSIILLSISGLLFAYKKLF